MNFPDFVHDTRQGKIIFRLLSNFSDQYNKNMYWIKSQYKLYMRRFERFPAQFLESAFIDYLTYEMPQFLPPIPEVYKYCRSRDDFNDNWQRLEVNVRYCQQCRTDDEGLEGGIRFIYYYGPIPSLGGRVGERTFAAKCNCQAGMNRTGQVYTEFVEMLKRGGGEVTFSYFSIEEGRTITAKEQSTTVWRQRVESGTYTDNGDGSYSPNFNHPIWSSGLGFMIAEQYNFDLPAHLEEIKREKEEERARERALKKMTFNRRLSETIASTGGGSSKMTRAGNISTGDLFK